MAAIEHTCKFNMMDQCTNEINEKEFSEVTYDLFFQMLRPGSLKNSREMFAKYLQWVSRQYSLSELEHYANSFELITAKWESVANLFYKANLLKKMDFLKTNVFTFIERVMVEERAQIKNLLLYILTTEVESV